MQITISTLRNVLLVISILAVQTITFADELSDAIAEADRLDPGWRLEQIIARRNASRLPDASNSVLQVERALKLLPVDWQKQKTGDDRPLEAEEIPRGYRLREAIGKLEPTQPLSANLARGLRAELDELSRAVVEARKLADLPAGQKTHTVVKNPLYIKLSYEEDSRKLARLLKLDVEGRIQKKDWDGAATSVIAIINVARSPGDAPFVLSQLVRMSIDTIAIQALTRILDQGTPSDRTLARLQDVLEKEAAEPRLLYAIRGERAIEFDYLSKLDSGELQLKDIWLDQGSGPIPRIPQSMLTRGFYPHNQARSLKALSELVEIFKRPKDTQQPLLERWLASVDSRKQSRSELLWNSVSYIWMPMISGAVDFEQRIVCELRSADAAVASIRFRDAMKHWPGSIDQLVPRYLKAVPLDPFAGETIHFKLESGGIVTYGAGKDRKDDGGRLNFKLLPGYDVGFRVRSR